MKKIIIGLLIVVLVSMLGCSSSSDGTPSTKKGSCNFPPTVQCLENSVQGNQFTLTMKSDLQSPIKITNEQFSLADCSQGSIVSVNADTTLAPVIQPGDEFTITISCSEEISSLGEAEIKFLYENQDTNLKHSLMGVVSS